MFANIRVINTNGCSPEYDTYMFCFHNNILYEPIHALSWTKKKVCINYCNFCEQFTFESFNIHGEFKWKCNATLSHRCNVAFPALYFIHKHGGVIVYVSEAVAGSSIADMNLLWESISKTVVYFGLLTSSLCGRKFSNVSYSK